MKRVALPLMPYISKQQSRTSPSSFVKLRKEKQFQRSFSEIWNRMEARRKTEIGFQTWRIQSVGKSDDNEESGHQNFIVGGQTCYWPKWSTDNLWCSIVEALRVKISIWENVITSWSLSTFPLHWPFFHEHFEAVELINRSNFIISCSLIDRSLASYS